MAVFGATGPVGGVAGLIAAKAGAKVTLVGYDGLQRVSARCDQFGERFGVALRPADGSDPEKNAAARRPTPRSSSPRAGPARRS